jgi:hypothetical protein
MVVLSYDFIEPTANPVSGNGRLCNLFTDHHCNTVVFAPLVICILKREMLASQCLATPVHKPQTIKPVESVLLA